MLAEYLSKYKVALSLLFTVLFSLSSMVWQSNVTVVALNQSGRAFDYFSQAFRSFGEGVFRVIDSVRSFQRLKQERDELQEQIKLSKNFIFLLNDLQRENQNYRQMLQLPQRQEHNMLLAEVIAQDPDNWFRTIIINKGSADGIAPYMPVVAYQTILDSPPILDSSPQEAIDLDSLNQRFIYGVVGKVIQVTPHSARVLPIFDQYSRLGVFVEKSGHWAQLIGQSPQHPFPRVDYVSLAIFLEEGDLVVTSGGEGVFPRGIPVGKVRGKILRMGSFQQAGIEPVLDFSRLSSVLVILKKPEPPAKNFESLSEVVE